jgi:hypothetical protein
MVKEMNDDGNDGEGDEMNRKCRVLFSRVRVYFISAAELFFISFVCYAISLYKKKIKKSCVAKATLGLNVCLSLATPLVGSVREDKVVREEERNSCYSVKSGYKSAMCCIIHVD